MTRVEKNKEKYINRLQKIKILFFSIFFSFILLTLLITGLKVVDNVNREMLLLDEEKGFFLTSYISEDVYEVVFLGEKYIVDVENIKDMARRTSIVASAKINDLRKALLDKTKEFEDKIIWYSNNIDKSLE